MNSNSKGHLLVTGAAGFIGSAFVRRALNGPYRVTILDALTYAGKMENIAEVLKPGSCEFIKGDIRDFSLVDELFSRNSFSGLINFAAESHVDNSITGPQKFIETNVNGTLSLLENTRKFLSKCDLPLKNKFRFVQISTDEVFGQLGSTGKFTEESPYRPNSPYSASKAASDHLVRSWGHTFGIPFVITNCSNNYGPRQHSEKLIPLMIRNAIEGLPLPVYGKGENIRDWIHVEDHVEGILLALEKGRSGQSYCFGGNCEKNNIQVVKSICMRLDELSPRGDGQKHEVAIRFVEDRLGHDFRYAIDDSKATTELGFRRRYSDFDSGLSQTIKWYLHN